MKHTPIQVEDYLHDYIKKTAPHASKGFHELNDTYTTLCGKRMCVALDISNRKENDG